MNKVKKFDCLQFKWKLQEDLYNKINPETIDDYVSKLKKLAEKSKLWEEINKH